MLLSLQLVRVAISTAGTTAGAVYGASDASLSSATVGGVVESHYIQLTDAVARLHSHVKS